MAISHKQIQMYARGTITKQNGAACWFEKTGLRKR